MPDKVIEKFEQVKGVSEQVKVLTPDAVDRIIDQHVTNNVALAEEGYGLFNKIKAMFKKKKKK
jgi:hypothetical protein